MALECFAHSFTFSLPHDFTFLSPWLFRFPPKLSSLFHFHFSLSLSFSSISSVLTQLHDLLRLPLSRLSRQRLSEQWAFSACSFYFNFLLCERSGVEFKCIVEVKFFFSFNVVAGSCCNLSFWNLVNCCGLCYEFCFILTLVFMLWILLRVMLRYAKFISILFIFNNCYINNAMKTTLAAIDVWFIFVSIISIIISVRFIFELSKLKFKLEKVAN